MPPRTLGPLAPAAIVALLLASPAKASPLDDPHVGGIGFSGPATGDLAGVYWNPAAIGLVTDNQILVAASARLSTLTLRRTPIDAATGAPGGDRAFPEARGQARLHPFSWPPGPGGLVAVAASLGTRVTIGLGAFSPFAERVSWAATTDGAQPASYHAVQMDLRDVALVPALSIRLGGGVRLGAAPGFLFSVGRLVFDEDTALAAGAAGLASDCGGAPCGVENPAAAARYDVSSGLDPFESSLSFTVAGGVHVQRQRWAAGAAYITRPLGAGGGVEIGARRTRIEPPARAQGQPPLCAAQGAAACVFGHVQYRLPDTVTGGFTYHLGPRLDLGVVLRWLNFSRHDAIRIRLVGPASGGLRSAGLPEQLVLYRGFRDVIDARVRAVVKLSDRVLISGTLRGESSAVPAGAVTAAAVDGFKVEPALAVQVGITTWLAVAAGYAITLMPAVSGGEVFDPTAEVACQQARGDLDVEACQKRRAGQARPAAAGRYTLLTHGFSVSLAAKL